MKVDNKIQKVLRKCLMSVSTALTIGLVFSQTRVNAQGGEAVFKKNCGVCHRVGGGKLVGPDLLGITTKRSEDWLMKWTKSSTTLINSGDADAKAVFEENQKLVMPDQALSDDELKIIFAFITEKSTGSQVASNDTAKKVVVADASNNATPEVIEMGKNIFLGSYALVNGGPACISCHNVNYKGVLSGGLLAKDLTSVFARLGGDAGLQGILGAPPFPAMTQSYKDKPLTEKEIAALIAFFNKVDKDKTNQIATSSDPLLCGGGVGVCGIMIMIFVIWFTRKKHTVKKDIYNRQTKSTN